MAINSVEILTCIAYNRL